MGIIDPGLPVIGDSRGDGEVAVRNALLTLLGEFNGNIDAANLKAGVIPTTTPGKTGLFRASLSADFAPSGIVPFDVEQFDVSSYFDTTTHKGRFTPTTPGYYRLSAVMVFELLDASSFSRVELRKNGSTYSYAVGFERPAADLEFTVTLTDIVLANGTDYFEIYFAGDGSPVSSGPTHSHFEGQFIGAP